MPQQEHIIGQPARIRPTRLIKHSHHFVTTEPWTKQRKLQEDMIPDVATQTAPALQRLPSTPPVPLDEQVPVTPVPHRRISVQLEDEDIDISQLSTRHIMQLSGMLRAVRIQKEQQQNGASGSEDGYWPDGIKQTGALPIVNLYGREPFGRSMPLPAVQAQQESQATAKPVPRWKALLSTPAMKLAIGLLAGIAMLALVAHVVNIPATITVIKQNLTTPRGIVLALLCGLSFETAFILRGIRWKFFLNPLGKVSTLKVVQIFVTGSFLNFALPIRGGEVAKSLMLKRIANIPISQSLPTVAMDKALDLMPALFIMAVVPFIPGIHMDISLWLLLGTVSGLLIGLIFFIVLAAWKRGAAIALLQRCTGLLPRSISNKIAGFATGFIDSLLAGASQPKVFLPAILMTMIAVVFEGLFAWLAFQTVGLNQITYGQALFGYTLFNMFFILPNPPGGVGSNELAGVLIFHGLLGFNEHMVLAMFVFSHPFTAIILSSVGMSCLSALGLNISSAMSTQENERDKTQPPQIPERYTREMASA